VPGVECRLWASAVSGRGHGRFWLARVGGRDVVVIAHRFAFALEHGVDALLGVPVLGHRCDNPCVSGSVTATSSRRARGATGRSG
jgi:hypothetical protein